MLSAIDDPADEIAIVAALRSPALRVPRRPSCVEFRDRRWSVGLPAPRRPPTLPADHPVVDGAARAARPARAAVVGQRERDGRARDPRAAPAGARGRAAPPARPLAPHPLRRRRRARRSPTVAARACAASCSWVAQQVDEEARAVEVGRARARRRRGADPHRARRQGPRVPGRRARRPRGRRPPGPPRHAALRAPTVPSCASAARTSRYTSPGFERPAAAPRRGRGRRRADPPALRRGHARRATTSS